MIPAYQQVIVPNQQPRQLVSPQMLQLGASASQQQWPVQYQVVTEAPVCNQTASLQGATEVLVAIPVETTDVSMRQTEATFNHQDPVVQSIVSLTISLRHKFVKQISAKVTNTLLFFC